MESRLSAHVFVSQPRSCKHGRALPIFFSSVLWLHWQRSGTFLPIPGPSMSGPGGRAYLVIMRAGKQSWDTITTTLRRAGLLAHLWRSHPQTWKHGRALTILVHLEAALAGESGHSWLIIFWGWGYNWLSDHYGRKTILNHHQQQHSGEQALYLTSAAQ